MTSLQKIRRWLGRKGYQLEIRNGLRWQTNLTDKKVTGDPNFHLDYGLNTSEKMALLLHECGHVHRQTSVVMLGTPWDMDLFVSTPARNEKPPSSWYIAIVREEADAWDVAHQLAKELKVEGLSRAMVRMRKKCLMSYIKWAAEYGDHTIGIRK